MNEERKYEFSIANVAHGSFYATSKGMKEFMGMVFESTHEGYCCEVNEDDD